MEGVSQLASNFGRIEDWRAAIPPEERLPRTAWTSGLVSTLQLTRLESTLTSSGHKIRGGSQLTRRRLFKSRLYRLGAGPNWRL